MKSARLPLLVLAVVAIVIVAVFVVRPIQAGPIDLAKSPPTIFNTLPYAIGETYTLGSTHVPPEFKRPITIRAVEVAHSSGIELLGTLAFEPVGDAIGAVPGWPPNRADIVLRDPFADGVTWPADVQPVIGVRIVQLPSGLRGVTVRWVDGDGVAGERTFDFAVLTCAPVACGFDDSTDQLLRELGLLR